MRSEIRSNCITFAVLLTATIATFTIAEMSDLGTWSSRAIVLAMLIKFACIAAVFMHLKHAHRLYLTVCALYLVIMGVAIGSTF